MMRMDSGDHLIFVIDDPARQADGRTLAAIGVTGYIGATRFDRFRIDLSTDLHVVARFERLRPKPVIDVPGLAGLPEFTGRARCSWLRRSGDVEPGAQGLANDLAGAGVFSAGPSRESSP